MLIIIRLDDASSSIKTANIYTSCWSCAARSFFNQITIHYIYTQKKDKKKKKPLITHEHALCTKCISKMLPVYVFGIFKAKAKQPRLPDFKRSSIWGSICAKLGSVISVRFFHKYILLKWKPSLHIFGLPVELTIIYSKPVIPE